MTLSPSDLDRLEELAKAATPGKRVFHEHFADDLLCVDKGPTDCQSLGRLEVGDDDGEFIAACDRETILELVAEVRRLREQPKKVLSADAVEWVVNSLGELGVKIGDQFFFLYKGESLVYRAGDDEDGPLRWRHVFKREFGECCHPLNYEDPTRYGTVSPGDSTEWKPLPLAAPEEP